MSSNPLDEFLEEYGPTKEAGIMDSLRGATQSGFGKSMVGGAGAAAGAAALTLGVGAIGAAAGHMYNAATKSRDYRQLLEHNADLHEHQQRDPKLFNQMFTSLRTLNPTFSKDPIVAGTLMRRMMDSPMTAGGILADVSQVRGSPSLGARATDEAIGAGKGYFGKPKNQGP